MAKKRLLVLSDMHCGHMGGLTPTQWQVSPERAAEGNLPSHTAEAQAKLWHAYRTAIQKLKPIDICVHNGDAIEGKGERSGGTELITTDREEQARMAVRCLNYVRPRDGYHLTYGTPYHTGVTEDFENLVARELGASIGSHEWFDIYGVVFDFKHFVSGSSIPHGRETALAKEKLWNGIWAQEHKQQPDADVLIRSHVHYAVVGGRLFGWRGYTTPALQLAATKFGGRKMTGLVECGLMYFDIYSDGRWQCHGIELVEAVRRAQATKLT